MMGDSRERQAPKPPPINNPKQILQMKKSTSSSILHNFRAAALAAVVLAASSTLHAQSWDGGGANNSWGQADNWVGNVLPAFTTTTDLVFDNLTRPNNFIGNNRFVRSISYGANIDSLFQANVQDFAGGTSRNLTLQADAGNASITVDAGAAGDITLGTAGGGGSFGSIILGSNLNVVHNGSGILLLNRPITGTGFGLTKTGTGTLELRAFNTATGALNIDEGTVIAGSQAADGQDINAFSGLNLRGGTLMVRTGFANKAIDTAPVTVSVASTLEMKGVPSGATNYNVTFGGAAGFALNADLTFENTSPVTTLTNGMTISRAMTGVGDIIVDTYNNIASSSDSYGLGRLALTGDNSGWSGDLRITQGTVSLGGALLDGQASGTGAIILGTTASASGAGLTFFSTAAAATTTTYGNSIIVNSGGFRSIKGGNTDHGVTFTGPITLNGNLNVDHTLSSVRAITLGGDITGVGGLDITRNGGSATTSVVLLGTNSYNGGTTIASGATLAIGAGGTTGSITGNVTNDGSLTFNRSDDLSFAGAISGSGSLTKLGAGVLTLAGTSGLTGDTAVNVGTLIVNGSLSSSLNDVSVAGGARIGGDGSVASTLSLASGAQFVFSLASTLDVVGAVTLDSSFGIASLVNVDGSVIDWSTFGNGVYTLIGTTASDFSGITNFGLANAADVGGGKSAYFQNGSLQLVVVPEPSTGALLAAGLIVLIVVRRRQMQKQD
jgi:autotransporter-associated beta strand protein